MASSKDYLKYILDQVRRKCCCREVNALAAEKTVPHEENFGKGLVPVDEGIISKYQEAGTEIRHQ